MESNTATEITSKDALLPQEWPGVYHMDELEQLAVVRVIQAKSPFRYYGPNLLGETAKLEEEFANFLGVQHCLAVSSGTAALQVALSAMGVGVGDEVLVPGYFWVATIGAVVRSGAIPRIVDVDDSYSLDPKDLEKKISPRTKVVIMVHMGGIVGQVDLVKRICSERGVQLLEDCAQSAGASVNGKLSGSFGDMAIFSFQLNKNMTAGEGGMIATNNGTLFKKSQAIHDLGYPRNERGRLVFDDPGLQLWGIGCRMSEITAAILRVQLRKLPKIVASMRSINLELRGIVRSYGLSPREALDESGIGGGFLEIIFENPKAAAIFKEALISQGAKGRANSLYPILMTEWGLHIYYNLISLTNRKSISGHHSVWELQENAFGREYSYQKGELPHLDALVERTVIFCIASKLTDEEKKLVHTAFHVACRAAKAC